jgi:hypothetical protein
MWVMRGNFTNSEEMPSGAVERVLQPPLASHKLPNTFTIVIACIKVDIVEVDL